MTIRPVQQTREGVFLSSTSDPVVKEYRRVARQVIEDDEFRDKWYVVEMGDFTAAKLPPAEVCRRKVLECAVYVGILGPIYGSICQSVGVSYVEYEYQVALDANHDIGVFLLPLESLKQEPLDIIVDQVPLKDRQDALRKRVRIHSAPTVGSIEEFKTQLRRYLRSLSPHGQWPMGDGADGSYDSRPLAMYHSGDLDQELLTRFLTSNMAIQELAQLGKLDAAPDTKLQALGFTTPNGLMQGTFLCFAPEALITGASSASHLYMRVYDGIDRATSRNTPPREVRYNLMRLFDLGMDFLRTALSHPESSDGPNGADLEIPEIMLREALSNALIHREYEHTSARNQPTRLEIYADRVEITSYGGLLGGVSELQLNAEPEQVTVFRRNPIITQIFMRMMRAEFGGGGVARIFHFARVAGLARPKIIARRRNPGFVRVILYRPTPASVAAPSITPSSRSPSDDQLLPVPDYFVGRIEEMSWVTSRLRRGASTGITALGGMGGIGKTALAAVAIRALRQEGYFRDGIAVILCMGHTDPNEILQLVLDSFATERNPTIDEHIDSLQSLYAFLSGKDVLIVLDNIEPDLDLERVISPLRDAGAVLLLTARQKMVGAGIPAAGWRELDSLPHDDALDLFAHAAGFRSIADLGDDASTAERIVETLQNHTLAVRLAGATVVDHSMDLTALTRELERDPLMLRSGHSMRYIENVLLSSVESLTPGARQLFITLAAFATEEWSRTTVTDVARRLRIPSPGQATHQLITRNLVDVAVRPDLSTHADQQRLRMHPLLRALSSRLFAQWPTARQMAAKEAVASVFAEHVQHVVEAELSADPLNIAGALEWACEHRKDTITVAICSVMQVFWNHRWLTKTSVHFLPRAIQAAERITVSTGLLEDRLQAANLQLAYAQILRRIGDLDGAERTLQANLVLRRTLGDRRGEAMVLSQLGLTARAVGRTEDAVRYLTDSVAIRREEGDEQGEADDLSVLARLARTRGDLVSARADFTRCIAIFSKTGDRRSEGINLGYLAQLPMLQGNLSEAEQLAHQSLEIAREVANKRGEAESLSLLAQIARPRGLLDDAEDYLNQSLEIRREVLDKRGEGADLGLLGRIAQARGRLRDAQHLFQRSLDIARQVHDRRGEAAVLSSLGQLALARDHYNEAETYLTESLALRRQVQDRQGESVDLSQFGRLHLDRGNFREAEHFLQLSLAIDREMHDRPGEGVDLSQLALVALEAKQYSLATTYLEQSLAIRHEVQDRRGEGVDLALLGRIALEQGALDDAQTYFQRSLDLAQRVQNHRGEGVNIRKLATVADLRGDHQLAEHLYRSSLAIGIEVGNGQDHIDSLAELGRFLIERDIHREEGCEMLRESVMLCRQLMVPREHALLDLMRRLGCTP
jgi:tetratricopeptide (TPR) repeat protein